MFLHFYRFFVDSNDLSPLLKILLKHLHAEMEMSLLLLFHWERFIAERIARIALYLKGISCSRKRSGDSTFLSDYVPGLSPIRFILYSMSH